MNEKNRPNPTAPLGEQEGEETELTGQPMDPQSTPHGNAHPTPGGEDDIRDTGPSDSDHAQHEQDRQLKTGEESPS
jgi:hypothetical protein